MTDYELKASQYAEMFGIASYHVKNDVMTYHVNFPHDGTYKVHVNLVTMQETRTKIEMMGVSSYNIVQ